MPFPAGIRGNGFRTREYSFCLLLLACISWGSFASIGIWRHDYIGYIDNYELKLATEGRWINYLLFKVLKASPPLVLIGIKLLTIALFVYIAARRYNRLRRARTRVCAGTAAGAFNRAGKPLARSFGPALCFSRPSGLVVRAPGESICA